MDETERPKGSRSPKSLPLSLRERVGVRAPPEPRPSRLSLRPRRRRRSRRDAGRQDRGGDSTPHPAPLPGGEGETPPPPPKPPAPVKRRPSLAERLREPEEIPVELPAAKLRARSRRDFLMFGAGALAAAAGFWWLLPDETKQKAPDAGLRDRIDSLEARLGADPERRERFLNRALTFDDDVAEALYSPDRSVRTYSQSQVTPLRNNYEGMTPDPGYIPGWTLAVSGLASGRVERLTIADLLARFPRHDQVTRLCCVEGWSMVAWWGGLRFADFLRAYPPAPGARWARLDSAVNLDSAGNSGPLLRLDRPSDRAPSADAPGHARLGASPSGRARRAPAPARADEAGPEEHQGDHIDRLLRRGARRLLERAGLLEIRRPVESE